MNTVTNAHKLEDKDKNNDAAKNAEKPKAAKRTSLWVVLLIAAGALGAVFFCIGGVFGLFKPLDIGVMYTDADYKSAIEKTGIKVTFEGLTELNNQWYDKDEYKISYSDFQHRVFELNSKEATALLDNIAPGIFWLDNVQLNVSQDGATEGSFTVNIKKLKVSVPSVSEVELAIPLPEKTNIYFSGEISIKDNEFDIVPKDVKIGFFQFPKQYLTDENINLTEQYLSEVFKTIPGLDINKFEQRAGKFYFDGVIPQRIIIEKSVG